MRLTRGKKVEVTQQLEATGASVLARWIGCFGVVWNLKVAEDERAFQEWNASARSPDSRPKPNQSVAHFVDKSRPWLGEVPSQIRRNAAAKWFEAKQAAIKGLRRNPRFRRPFGKKSCVVTSELFEARLSEGQLLLAFKASAASVPYCALTVEAGLSQTEAPRSVVVSRVGGRFFVSWSYEYEAAVEDEVVLANRLALSPEDFQEQSVLAVDVGVAKPATLSDGTVFDFSSQAKLSFKRLEKRKRRYQKRMARAKKGSNNRRKLRFQSAHVQAKAKRIRNDFFAQHIQINRGQSWRSRGDGGPSHCEHGAQSEGHACIRYPGQCRALREEPRSAEGGPERRYPRSRMGRDAHAAGLQVAGAKQVSRRGAASAFEPGVRTVRLHRCTQLNNAGEFRMYCLRQRRERRRQRVKGAQKTISDRTAKRHVAS